MSPRCSKAKKKAPVATEADHCNPQPLSKGVLLSVYPKEVPEGMLVVYDLREPPQWIGARHDREAWGRERSEIHPLDNDHVLIEFKPGESLEASA